MYCIQNYTKQVYTQKLIKTQVHTNRHDQPPTHTPSPASRSTPWGRPWACPAWRCTAGQCSPWAAVECCVSARTAHTPSGSAPPRCSYFQMPWRQPQPCSVTSNLCTGENGTVTGGQKTKERSMISLVLCVESDAGRVCVSWWGTDGQKTWEKSSQSEKALRDGVCCFEVLLSVRSGKPVIWCDHTYLTTDDELGQAHCLSRAYLLKTM